MKPSPSHLIGFVFGVGLGSIGVYAISTRAAGEKLREESPSNGSLILDDAFNAAAWLGDQISNLANSSFFIALAGAFAGAYGAQWIVERIESKRRLLSEIRSTNAAIMVAFGITNSYITIKDQHIKSLKERYDGQCADLQEFLKRRHEGTLLEGQLFEFVSDFKTLLPIRPPISVLQDLLFEKISVTGRPLTLVSVLSHCIDSLNSALDARNATIAKFRENPETARASTLQIYFGVPDKGGHIDRSYPDAIDAISAHTDDCIFFSKLIAGDLVAHGKRLAKAYGSNSPKIGKLDFSEAEQKGLMPDSGLYDDWTSKFQDSVDKR